MQSRENGTATGRTSYEERARREGGKLMRSERAHVRCECRGSPQQPAAARSSTSSVQQQHAARRLTLRQRWPVRLLWPASRVSVSDTGTRARQRHVCRCPARAQARCIGDKPPVGVRPVHLGLGWSASSCLLYGGVSAPIVRCRRRSTCTRSG